jgi:hypothetical protein
MKRVQRKIKGFNDQKPESDDEQCQRCKKWGEDRRTLWQACFYAMDEYDVPFKQVQITGHLCEQNGTEHLELLNKEIPTFAAPNNEEKPYDHRFFTLRVCKECRASWMRAIADWFQAKPSKPESCGSGIFIRRDGINVEVTLEEWHQLQKEKNNEDQ